MTIHQWRSDPELVKRAAAFLNDPLFAEMLNALATRSVVAAQPLGASPDDKATILGEAIGYRACLDTIRSLGVQLVSRPEPESTFEPPEAEVL